VLPALIMRFHEAASRGDPEVTVWGSGSPRREFLHVDDMADAAIFVLNMDEQQYKDSTQPMLSHINVGYGDDVSISELAAIIAEITGFGGRIVFDASKPDGTPRKLLDVSLLSSLGWTAQIRLRDGIRQTYDWFRANFEQLRH